MSQSVRAPRLKRDMPFVSHSNPEDNTFALWLTLRLGELRFKVWCDLTKLIGGETFWDNAEEAIRNSTAMFLYVLSRTSNSKDGVLRELQLAQALAKASRRTTLSCRFALMIFASKTRRSNYSAS